MPPPSSRRRILSLDALRGVAVFLMIEQHVGIWMWKGPAPGRTVLDYPILVGFNALGGMAAPLFVTLAGLGSALFVASGRRGLDGTLVRRGLVLMLFGYVLNLLTPSWFSWGTWFVLHMMGFAMALAPLWRRLPTGALLGGCGLVLAATVGIQTWLDTPSPLTNPRMRDVTMPGGPLRLAVAEGQFPIFPWLTFYLAGFVAGRWVDQRRLRRVGSMAIGFLAVGAAGYALYETGVIPSSAIAKRAFALRLGFFPATVSIVCLLLGGALLLITLFATFEDRRGSLRPDNPLVTLGRGSLTLLMVHVPVFRDLSRPIGLWQALEAGPALAVVSGVVVASVLACRLWKQIDFRWGAEWALRRIAG